jgi:hypothetical protein
MPPTSQYHVENQLQRTWNRVRITSAHLCSTWNKYVRYVRQSMLYEAMSLISLSGHDIMLISAPEWKTTFAIFSTRISTRHQNKYSTGESDRRWPVYQPISYVGSEYHVEKRPQTSGKFSEDTSAHLDTSDVSLSNYCFIYPICMQLSQNRTRIGMISYWKDTNITK